MTTEDRKAFEEWLASEPSLIRAPSYDATAEVAWQAATARERERCARIAEGDRSKVPDGRVKSHVVYLVVLREKIAAAIRARKGGENDTGA